MTKKEKLSQCLDLIEKTKAVISMKIAEIFEHESNITKLTILSDSLRKEIKQETISRLWMAGIGGEIK